MTNQCITTSGAAWKAYYTDPKSWPEDAWHDGLDITFDGVPSDLVEDLRAVADSCMMIITSGQVFFEDEAGSEFEVQDHFRAWQAAQSYSFVVVSIPKDRLHELQASVAVLGGSVLTP